jgi:hypothetical protein
VLLVAAIAAAACTTALGAPAREVDLLKAFARDLPNVKRVTSVPVLLPAALPLGGTYRLYPSGGGTRGSWQLSLAGAPSCGGANACFVASFEGRRGARLPLRANVRLRNGDPAVYRAFSCGGSCSPTSFWFAHGGVLYSWQVKDLPRGAKAILVRLADQAIAAGPR